MPLNILFVDDEPHILQGLKRSFRGQRKEWNMSFALGGAEALQLTDDMHFDAVISDMRMPEVDGAAVLKAVRDKSPDTVRVVLSGYSEMENEIQREGYSHRYLKKPCSSTEIKKALAELLPISDH